MSNTQAVRFYRMLCDGDTSAVSPTPAIAALHDEIALLYPEIDAIPDGQVGNHELSPWSIAMDRSEGHLVMCCVWPRADYVG